ncbi:DUF4344 domain-containing metallopeptidase [Alkalinema pantanalense CENA528]|uniref:DUF4344 domain-containing metallopeptidase n=1 Tax=Alkalinema pantanalense TaxID=1620705 RepID=UPI003D6EDF6F
MSVRSCFREWPIWLATLTAGFLILLNSWQGNAVATLPPTSQIAQSGGQFQVAYSPVKNAEFAPFRQVMQESRLYETIAEELNKVLLLPTDVTIALAECGTENAFYSADHKSIVMCDELLAYFGRLFAPTATSDQDLGESMLYTNLFVFFHELGHGLIDLYDLPTTGREEDAVDEFSTILLLEAGTDGEKAVLNAAHWFALQSEQPSEDLAFWDEHSLDLQRFYGIACLVYGKDPEKFSDLVKEGLLPEARAQRCGREYAKKSQSWDKLLVPHVRS